MRRKGLIFIISGPSGSGKTTLYNRLLKKKDLKSSLVKSISFTTRPKRKGEREGRDYHFLARTEFLNKKGRGEFLETQEVFGRLYGTSKSFVQETRKRGKDVLLCIDVKGAGEVKRIDNEAILIFILPPTWQALRQRLKSRSTETKDLLSLRLQIAKQELGFLSQYDYVVVNDSIREALKKLEAIIIAERCRRLAANYNVLHIP